MKQIRETNINKNRRTINNSLVFFLLTHSDVH